MLYRHLRGEKISLDEFERLRREPMHQGGPLNVRPYLSQEWYKNGGSGAVCLSIGFSANYLPFMPTVNVKLATDSRGEVQTPPFLSLLPRNRFFHRCHIVKQQSQALARHPLFLELSACKVPSRVERTRKNALHWRQVMSGECMAGRDDIGTNRNNDTKTREVVNLDNPDVMYSNACASLGNVSSLFSEMTLTMTGSL